MKIKTTVFSLLILFLFVSIPTEVFSQVTIKPCRQWDGPCDFTDVIWRDGPVGIGIAPQFIFAKLFVDGGGTVAGISTAGPIGIAATSTGPNPVTGGPGLAGSFTGSVLVNYGSLTVNGDGDVNGTLEVDKLHALESVHTKEVHVILPPFPDYVFEKNYPLLPLDALSHYIEENKKLPNMPSANEVAENGAELGELQILQTEKIEELTLYILELNERLKKLELANELLKKQMEENQDK